MLLPKCCAIVAPTGEAGSNCVDMRVCEQGLHPPTASSNMSAGTWCLKEHLCNASPVLSSSRCHVCTAGYSAFFKVYWSLLCFLQNRSQPEATRPPQLCSTARQMVRKGHVARSHSLLTKAWPCELFYSHFFMCPSNRVTADKRVMRQTKRKNLNMS